MSIRYNRIILIIALIALAAPAFAAMEIIPCVVGNKWDYDCYKVTRATIKFQDRTMATFYDPSSGSSTYEIAGVDDKASPPLYDYRETNDLTSANGNTDTDKVQLKLTSGSDGIRLVSSYGESSGEKPETQTYSPPLFYYSNAAVSGKGWEIGMIREGDTQSLLKGQGAGRETVTVPAGTFKDCLKVIYSSEEISGKIDLWEKEFTVKSGRVRNIYWIADGVGVVKELEVSTAIAETPGPDGTPVSMETASCSVSELKPGYTVKK